MGHPLASDLFRLQACVLCENCNTRFVRYVGFDDFDGCGGEE